MSDPHQGFECLADEDQLWFFCHGRGCWSTTRDSTIKKKLSQTRRHHKNNGTQGESGEELKWMYTHYHEPKHMRLSFNLDLDRLGAKRVCVGIDVLPAILSTFLVMFNRFMHHIDLHFYLPLLTLFDLCRCMHCNWMFRLIVEGLHPFEITAFLEQPDWMWKPRSCQFRTSGGLFHVHVTSTYIYVCIYIFFKHSFRYYIVWFATLFTSESYIHISDCSLCILRWWAGFSDRLISATLPSPGVSMRPRDFPGLFSLIQTGSSRVPIRDGTPTSCK